MNNEQTPEVSAISAAKTNVDADADADADAAAELSNFIWTEVITATATAKK